MRKPFSLAILAALSICFISCSKDNNSTNASSLSGNWTFKGIHAITSSTAVDKGAGFNSKIVSTSDYTTFANGGTMNVSGTTMAGTGITYSANILVLGTEYEDDLLVDTFSSEIPFVVPETSSTSTFEVIGKDSIHYTSSSMFGAGGSGTPASTGAKFSVSGDILTLTSSVVQDKIIDEGGGETVTQHETAIVVATLQKK